MEAEQGRRGCRFCLGSVPSQDLNNATNRQPKKDLHSLECRAGLVVHKVDPSSVSSSGNKVQATQNFTTRAVTTVTCVSVQIPLECMPAARTGAADNKRIDRLPDLLCGLVDKSVLARARQLEVSYSKSKVLSRRQASGHHDYGNGVVFCSTVAGCKMPSDPEPAAGPEPDFRAVGG